MALIFRSFLYIEDWSLWFVTDVASIFLVYLSSFYLACDVLPAKHKAIIFSIFKFFLLFKGTPVAYGSFRARGQPPSQP